jgi:hypothetical protein
LFVNTNSAALVLGELRIRTKSIVALRHRTVDADGCPAACAAYKLLRAHARLLTPGFTKIILKL